MLSLSLFDKIVSLNGYWSDWLHPAVLQLCAVWSWWGLAGRDCFKILIRKGLICILKSNIYFFSFSLFKNVSLSYLSDWPDILLIQQPLCLIFAVEWLGGMTTNDVMFAVTMEFFVLFLRFFLCESWFRKCLRIAAFPLFAVFSSSLFCTVCAFFKYKANQLLYLLVLDTLVYKFIRSNWADWIRFKLLKANQEL